MERKIVAPGDLITDKRVKLGPNVFVEGGKVFSKVLGLAEIGPVVKVIPLEGRYIPKPGDAVVGIISDVKIPGFDVWINSPYTGFLPRDQLAVLVEDGDFSVCVPKAVYEKVKNGERVERFEVSVYKDFFGRIKADREEIHKVYKTFDEFRAAMLIMKKGEIVFGEEDVDYGDIVYARVSYVDAVRNALLVEGVPLKAGEILAIQPVKVPRVIGKNASMLEVLRKAADDIAVGSNGVIWVRKGNVPLLKKALKKIEREAHTKGLTDRVKNLIEGDMNEA